MPFEFESLGPIGIILGVFSLIIGGWIFSMSKRKENKDMRIPGIVMLSFGGLAFIVGIIAFGMPDRVPVRGPNNTMR